MPGGSLDSASSLDVGGGVVTQEEADARYVALPDSPSVYTQTYATADRTHAAKTAAAVATTSSTAVTPFGYSTAAQADAIVTNLNALRNDNLDLAQVVNGLIDDLQARNLVG